ncbi:hypothetical protein [Anaeropeptidivorans aminofermentans]|jgi:hypothetical protein|uniref:hypothetical protein n=1 Tax=Anaeropeptidivorans aminofermentans TaxID=2934315 RepID=UPI0020250F02|nr:hypothetical protein [Anaeropeptidivorans aminofermentans]
MKKGNLYTGIGFILTGILLILIGYLLRENIDSSFLFGWSGGLIGPGILSLYKYYRWSSPENAGEYEKRLKEEKINLNDERKIMLRDKSGRIAYVIGMLLLALIIIIISVIRMFDIANISRWLVLGISLFLMFQYFLGIVVYRHLSKKL